MEGYNLTNFFQLIDPYVIEYFKIFNINYPIIDIIPNKVYFISYPILNITCLYCYLNFI